MDAEQRIAMNVIEKEGQVFSDHWFVMVAATKTLDGLTVLRP